MKLQLIMLDYLMSKDIPGLDETNISFNSFKYDGNVVLSGNRCGLIILADYIISTALSDESTHIHLDQDNFFNTAEDELIIEFKKSINKTSKSDIKMEEKSIMSLQCLALDYLRCSNISDIEEDHIAEISLEFDREVILSGNRLGLIMLADYFVNIALSDTSAQVYLDQNNFFNIADEGLVIELGE